MSEEMIQALGEASAKIVMLEQRIAEAMEERDEWKYMANTNGHELDQAQEQIAEWREKAKLWMDSDVGQTRLAGYRDLASQLAKAQKHIADLQSRGMPPLWVVERDRLVGALRQIANIDYRGNRSPESTIAFEALKGWDE